MLYRASVRVYLCVFALICIGVNSVTYAENSAIYQFSTPVQNQTRVERKEVFKQGMGVLILRLTGSEQLLQKNEIITIINQADGYVQSYNYQAIEGVKAGDDVARYILNVNYNSTGVNNALFEQGVPIWTGERPNVLIWLVEKNHSNRTITDSNSRTNLQDALLKAAKKRGLQVHFPIGDVEDLSAISPSMLWGLFSDTILKASKRYGSSAILALRADTTDENRVNGRAQFYFQGGQFSQNIQKNDINQWSDTVMNQIGSQMASFYASSRKNEHNLVEIQVSGIASPKSYANMLSYFSGLSVVEDVSVNRFYGNSILLSLVINSSLTQYEAVVNLASKLKAVNQSATPKLQDWHPVYYYVWRER